MYMYALAIDGANLQLVGSPSRSSLHSSIYEHGDPIVYHSPMFRGLARIEWVISIGDFTVAGKNTAQEASDFRRFRYWREADIKGLQLVEFIEHDVVQGAVGVDIELEIQQSLGMKSK